MKIKLIAIDIDGTLLDSSYRIGEETRRALAEAIATGILIVLVTGRRFAIARPIALELGLHTPLISHNGALTKHIETLEVIDYHPLSASLARQAVELARPLRADVVCSYDPQGYGRVVTDIVSEENIKLRRYLDKSPMIVEQVADLRASIREDPIQVMSAGPCALMDQFEQTLAYHLDGKVKLLKTAYPAKDMTILDILAPDCSKAVALAAVVERFGLSRQEVMAIGDNHNDLEMLAYAGLGVVMGNAEERLRKLGFPVTATNDENGVAQAIAEFVLKG
jgi:hypothetical protein